MNLGGVLFTLMGKIDIDNEKAKIALKDTNKEAKDAKTTLGGTITQMASTGLKVGSIVTGAATAVTGVFTALESGLASTADTFDKSSLRTGIQVEELQRLNYAATQSGVSLESVEKSAKTLNKEIAAATNGNKEATNSFNQLGVSLTNTDGSAKSTTEIYDQVLTKLADLGDTTEATTIGTQLFGKAYTDMKPLLAEGSAGINELKNNADELGIVLDQNTVSNGVKFGDTMKDVELELNGFKNTLMSSLLPALQSLLDKVKADAPQIQDTIKKAQPTIELVLNICITLLKFLFEHINVILPIVVTLWGGIKALKIMDGIMKAQKTCEKFFTALSLNPTVLIIAAIIAAVVLLIMNWDKVKVAAKVVCDFVVNVFTNVKDKLKTVLDNITSFFSGCFNGLVNIVKWPINLIIDGLNTFIRGLDNLKIPDWVPGVGGKGISIPLIPRLAKGLDYVPYDEMPALLHKGERVMTAKENEKYSDGEEKKVENNSTINNNFYIEKIEVKKESDIQDIAEELYYMQKKATV